MGYPKVSIVITTFNRYRSLERLVASLRSLETGCCGAVELIIVDNGSTDPTGRFLEHGLGKSDSLEGRIVRETRRGKANALNAALLVGQGDIFLILDDDVVVDPAIVTEHVQCYSKTGFDAVQGRIMPGNDPGGRTADLTKLQEYNIPLLDHGQEYCELRGLTGTNMSFKREVFERVGFFNPSLGPGASGFSEDTEYSMRIRRAGFKIGYTPHAIVYHELNPARYGRAYNRQKEYRKGASRSIYRNDSIIFRVLPDMLANCVRYGVYKLLGWNQKAYKTEGRILKCCGYLMGKFRGESSLKSHGV